MRTAAVAALEAQITGAFCDSLAPYANLTVPLPYLGEATAESNLGALDAGYGSIRDLEELAMMRVASSRPLLKKRSSTCTTNSIGV